MIERMKKIMKRMYNKPVVETSELQAASQLLQDMVPKACMTE